MTSSKLIENMHNIININNLTMIKMDKVLSNLTVISESINEKKNDDIENIDGLNNKLSTIETKNDFVDDKLLEIERKIGIIFDRIDIMDDKIDSINTRINTLNMNLNTLLKALKKK